jgi:hypothetical protein
MDNEETIYFDEFNTSSVEDLFRINFTVCNLKKGEFANVSYKFFDEEIKFEDFKASTNKFLIRASAERIPVKKITKFEVKEEERQEGYVFNGTIFVSPRTLSIENLGGGGRILTFVHEDIHTLEKLILSDAQTDKEINKRFDLIRKSYPEIIREENEARFQDKIGGKFPGSFEQRHGYP